MAFLNECYFRAASSGTGDFVVSSAITGFYTPAQCTDPTPVDGGYYRYRAESDDLSEYETGYGHYTVGTATLTRNVRQSSNSGSKVSFTAAPRVRVEALAEDLPTRLNVKSFGAVGDYNVVFDGAMAVASSTLTSASNPFTSADVGKYIAVEGAGASGANLFTTIATYVGAGQVTLTDANASGGAVSAATVEWGTDDTAAFQAAIDAAKAIGGGAVYIPVGSYLVSRLDMTGIGSSVALEGEGVNSSRLFPMHVSAYSGTAGHVIDLTGSLFARLRRFQIGAYYSLPQPQTAIFLSQIASGVSNRIFFDEAYVTGQYAIATVYNYGVPSSIFRASDFYNYTAGAGAHCVMKMTKDNANSLTSSFATVTTGTLSTSDWSFYGCEWHKFAGAGANNSVIILDQVSNVLFSSGVISGGAARYVEYSGTNAEVTFDNVTFETESQPVTPTNAFYLDSGATLTDYSTPQCSYVLGGAVWAGSGTRTGPPQAGAWVKFNGTGTVAISRAFNVSSITDNAVGNYTVNFTRNLSAADYGMTGAVGQESGGATGVGVVGQREDTPIYSTSQNAIYTMRPATSVLADYPKVCVSYWGD